METVTQFPIRVLHMLHSMNRGGAENALMNYYRSLDRSVIQFDFLLTEPDKCCFEDEILALGGRVYRVPPLTIKHPLRYINSVRCFFKSHPKYKIVHSHTSSKSVVPLAIAKLYKVPIRISHSHNSKSEAGINGFIREALMPFLKVTANVYFSCGVQAAEWLYGRKFCDKGYVHIIRNAICAQKFQYNPIIRKTIREKLGINNDTFVIGQVARFCEEKNHKFSIDILKAVITKKTDTVLLLVGDGSLRDEISAYAKSKGVELHVMMVGVVPNVYDYEQAMDTFILPSFYEGLPLSIIEAQVSGLPCFTTKGTVSEESSVTNLVSYLPLEAGANFWAEKIIKSYGIKRIDRFNEVKDAGYDSETSTKILQEFYIKKFNEIR